MQSTSSHVRVRKSGTSRSASRRSAKIRSSQSGMKVYGWDKAEVPMRPQRRLPKELFEHTRREDNARTRDGKATSSRSFTKPQRGQTPSGGATDTPDDAVQEGTSDETHEDHREHAPEVRVHGGRG